MYQLTNSNSVIRLFDNATIPCDDANRDWQEYQLWLLTGNTPNPIEPIVEDEIPSPIKVITDLLISKSVVTQADVTAAEQDTGVVLNQSI